MNGACSRRGQTRNPGSRGEAGTCSSAPRASRTWRRIAALAVWALLSTILSAPGFLSGCGRAPAVRQELAEVSTPPHWTALVGDSLHRTATRADSSVLAGPWWRSFGNASLDTLVTEALSHNRDLRAAQARVDRALAQARIAGADLYPGLQAALSSSRRKQNYIGLPIPGPAGGVRTSYATSYTASLESSWELDLWGRIRSGKSAALAEAEAGLADYRGALLSVAGQTAKAWFAAVEARLQWQLSRTTAASYRATADQVRDRYEHGLRSSLDLRLALANLASAEADRNRRRQQYDAAKRRLEVLVGRYPAAAVELAPDLPAVPGPVPGGLPSTLVARRPDLAAAERRAAAADARLSQARASLYPRLSLTASGGTSSNQLSDLVDGSFSVWTLVGNLVQPIFQGGRLRAQVALSRAQTREALENFASALLRAYSEVETALASESLLANEEKNLRESVVQADAARRLAENQYRAGLVDFITVLEAQRGALAQRSRLLSAQRARLDNRVNLHLALGGDFVPRPDRTPAPTPDSSEETTPR